MKDVEWEKAKGVFCPRCKEDTLRLINGMCPLCAEELAYAEAKKREARALIRELRRQIRTQGMVDPELLK